MKTHSDFNKLLDAFKTMSVQQTRSLPSDRLGDILGSLKKNLVEDKKRMLLAYIHVNDQKLYKYLV